MNPLAIRIAADLKAFKANMDEMRTQLETNSAAMKRMANAFDGNKVIGDANAMVKAIHDIGGASKLTESEQRRVNAAVTEALAKYHALGREAPAELLALRDATNKVEAATKQVQAPVDSLSSKLNGMAGTLGIAFGSAAVIGGVKSLISSTLEYAETIKDTSGKLGISMEATQRWKFAAEQTGASLENVSKSVLKLSQGLAGDDKSVKQALKVAGLEFDKIRAMKPEDGFTAVFDAVSKIPDPMLQSKLMLELFGKSGAELIPAMREGMSDLAKSVKTMSDETIKRLDDAKDAWSRLGTNVTIITGEMVGDTLAGFEDVTTIIENFGRISKEAWTNGIDAALRLTGELGRFKDAVYELTDAQKKEVDQLLKNGIPANKIYDTSLGKNEASVMAYIASLKKSGPALHQFGEDNKKAAKVVKESWSFTGSMNEELFNFGASVQKQIEEGLVAYPGETLEELLARRWKMGKSFSGDFKGELFDFSAIIQKQIDEGIIAAPGETLEELLKRRWGMAKSFSGNLVDRTIFDNFGEDAAESWAEGFISFMGQAASGLVNSIVAAIQGGGNVLEAAVASLATSTGQFFSSKFAEAVKAGTMSAGMAQILSAGVTGIVGVISSIIGDMLKPVYTFTEQLSQQFGESTTVIKEQLRSMGAAGKAAFDQMTSSAGSFFDKIKAHAGGYKDAQSMLGFLDQFQTKDELAKIAAQWKGVYDYMLTSGKYTAQQLADAWKQYEDAQKKAIGAVDPEDTRPIGARGFPTKAQLQTAVNDAREAYEYMKNSGLYTADVLEQAWQQWQDAMIASGDETAKRMKDLTAEITSLQKAVELETPEYDADGVRIYGVEELRNIERLKALEDEKTALQIANIKKAEDAVQVSAEAAALQANKEFEAAKLRAVNLDDYLRKLFSGGYEIPITFRLPGSTPGGNLPGSNQSSFGHLPQRSSGLNATITIHSVNEMDGEVVARKTVKHTVKLLPKELDFIGARR